jgi:hypothetical protein
MASKNSRKSTPVQTKTQIVHFYGTKNEWVKYEFPYPEYNFKNITNNGLNDHVVVCEDENGLYITGKSYVGALTVDPYRMYERKKAILQEDGTYTF